MYDRQAVRRVTIATLIGSLDTQHMLAVADRRPDIHSDIPFV